MATPRLQIPKGNFTRYALLVLASFVCGYLVTTAFSQQGDVATGGTVSMMVDGGAGQVMTYLDLELVAGETLFDLTQRIAKQNNLTFSYKDYPELGVFITQIGPSLPVPLADAYWQYWVNNRYALIGADRYKPIAGDVIFWKFARAQE